METSSIVTGYSYMAIDAEEIERQYLECVGQWEKSRTLNRDAKLVHMAAHNALRMSGIDLRKADKSKIGAVLATTLGTFESYETFFESMHNHEPKPSAFSNALPNISAGALSVFYGLTGPSLTLSCGPIGGIDALMLSLDMIEEGICDAVLAGAWYMPSRTTAMFGLPPVCEAAMMLLQSSGSIDEGRQERLARIRGNYHKNVQSLLKGVADPALAVVADRSAVFFIGEHYDQEQLAMRRLSESLHCESLSEGHASSVELLKFIIKEIASVHEEKKRSSVAVAQPGTLISLGIMDGDNHAALNAVSN